MVQGEGPNRVRDGVGIDFCPTIVEELVLDVRSRIVVVRLMPPWGDALLGGFFTAGPRQRSGFVEGHAASGRQRVRLRTMALSVTKSFRMTAIKVTFFGRSR